MKRKLLLLTMASMVAVAACDKDNDDNNSPTTVAEDKANIQASFDRVKNLLQSFRSGSLSKFTSEFIGYHQEEVEDPYGYYYRTTNEYGGYGNYSITATLTPGGGWERYSDESYGWVGEGNGSYSITATFTPGGEWSGYFNTNTYYDDVISDFVELLGNKLEGSVDFDGIEQENRFNLASFSGTYTWNNDGNKWDKTQNSSIVARFPAAEGQANTCELALTEYADKACNIEGETIYLPTKAKAYLKKDNEMLASIDVSASFTNYGIPQQANASIYAKPVTVNTSLKQEAASKYSANVAIADETNADNNLSVSAEMILSNGISQYTDFDDCKINVLRFTITQSDLTITGTIDVKTLDAISNPSVSDINTCISIEVFYRNAKTGTLNVKEVGKERYLYITYKDETQENTSVYYDGFVEDVKAMYKNYWDAPSTTRVN